MKKTFLWALIAIVPIFAKCQDTIITKKGEEIKSRVAEIGLSTVKYKLFNNLTGPVFEINKSDVFEIKYENGTKNVFTPQLELIDPCLQGKNDAKKYYHNGNAAARGTFFTALFAGGLLGLIPAIATSSTPPKDKNLDYPNADLMKNPDYARCYIHTAKKRKQGKVWTLFGIGIAINVAAALILYSTQ